MIKITIPALRNKTLLLLLVISVSLIFSNQFSILSITHEFQINESNPIEKTSFDGFNENTLLNINSILLSTRVKVSNTGLNSTHTRLIYNPNTQKVGISWIINLPGSASLYFVNGNSTISWSDAELVETILDTISIGYYPVYDDENDIHFVFEEFAINKYDLQEIILLNGVTPQSKTALTANSGNSTLPVANSDKEDIIHLVWRDTTANTNGDLLYTHYNATTSTWNNTFTNVTSGKKIVSTPVSLVADENNTVHLIWVEQVLGDQELYYSYLQEGTSSWSTAVKISNVGYAPIQPIMTFNNYSKKLEILFRDNGTTSNLYYLSGKAKGGSSDWSSPISLSPYLADKSEYSICTDEFGNSLVVYETLIGGIRRIYLQQKNNAGSWGTTQLISTTNLNAYDPAIIIDTNGRYYIAYSEVVNQASEVYIVNGWIDSDSDGLSDLDEINVYFSNPSLADTDGDTLSDGDEVLIYSTNPLSDDSDNDQMPDDYEIEYNFNPINSTDAALDYDQDNLTNLEEYEEGTNPLIADTDGDTLEDGEEVNVYLTDPLKVDTDGDTLSDGYEVLWGLNPLIEDDIKADPDGDGLTTEFESIIWTDPTNPDTDGDGVNDGIEVNHGTNPLDPNDYPTESQEPKDYSRVITIVLVCAGVTALFLMFSILLAQQFKPKEAHKRKELEREQSTLFQSVSDKGRKMTWEDQEKELITQTLKKETKTVTLETDKLVEAEVVGETPVEKLSEPKKPAIRQITPIQEAEEYEVNQKREKLRKIISELQGYELQLDDILKKKMTTYTLSTSSREGLTEFATESQRIYSEAKAYWNSNILPLIKGFEEKLYIDTLEAERIIDHCELLANQILDVLVEREMEFTEDEERKEDVKKKAEKALGRLREKTEVNKLLEEEEKEEEIKTDEN